jgi:hypothetical protein
MATAGALFSLVAFGGYICVWFSWVSSGGCAEVGVLEVVDLHYIPFDGSTKNGSMTWCLAAARPPHAVVSFNVLRVRCGVLRQMGHGPPV